jgi:uncharacterized tellurite resistance protein B-like protein
VYLFDVLPEHARTLVEAMRAVALADGEETPQERALIEVARDTLGLQGPIESFAPLAEDSPALADLGPTEREHVIQTMLLLAIMDGRGSPEEAALIQRFAARLAVSEPRVKNLEQLAAGRFERMKFDLTRKGYAKDEFIATAKEEGLEGLYRTFGPLLGLGKSAEVAQKYIDLGKLPAGTLGRAYFDFIYANGLDFPGEGAIGERGVWHDIIHVMGDYHVDPAGEAEVVAFMAGFRREDPFFWVFTSVLQFQVGLRISPFAPGVPDQVRPRRYLAHHKRGSLVTCDLSRDWDFRADFATPLAELRARFNVVPLADPRVGLV